VIKQAVESLGTRRPVYEIQPMQTYVDRSIGDARFTMLVLVGFALAALLLARSVCTGRSRISRHNAPRSLASAWRWGATAARILRSVASEGLLLTAIGGALGLVGALGASAVLRDLLYGVAPDDTTTLMSVTVLVAVVALIAASRPAWTAAKTDPCAALRAE
jgi:putative ABC transport system permease protein